jgi:hypothetical protein
MSIIKTRATRKSYAIASLMTLCLGFAIYLLFRSLNIILFTWLPKPAVFDALFIPLVPSPFTSLLRHNLLDMLWFMSAILLIRALWFNNRKWQRIYITAFCVLALAIEITQLSERVPGTFDPLDFLFMGIGAFVEGLLYNFYITRRLK